VTNPAVRDLPLAETGSLRGAAYGFGLFPEALGVLQHQRSLWTLAAVPVALATVALLGALGVAVSFLGELQGLATDWIPALEATAWYQWLWIGPGIAFFWLVGKALFLALLMALVVGALLLANLVSAPFLDALSLRVETLESGEAPLEAAGSFSDVVRGGTRALGEELRRLLFFIGVWVAISVVGFIVPGAQLLVAPALTAFTIFFLPLDYASYALDRREVSFARKREWLLEHRGVVAGFGATGFALCLIPVLNLVATPVLVVAGTLLALRLPEPRGGPL
jgi:uncharacterized protein involved in cysteine biosynthesis